MKISSILLGVTVLSVYFGTVIINTQNSKKEQRILDNYHSEAKNIAGTFNRAQMSYHLENKTFAESFTDLDIVVEFQNYEIVDINVSNNQEENFAQIIILPKDPESELKSYAGGVSYRSDLETGLGFQIVTCESLEINGEIEVDQKTMSCSKGVEVEEK